MSVNTARICQYLRDFNFGALFIEELRWDRYRGTLPVVADGSTYTLTGIAQKSGVVVYVRAPDGDGNIPPYNTRVKIEREVTKAAHEHIIIYVDTAKTTQIWQYVRRQAGQPDRRGGHIYTIDQSGESLIQKLQSLVIDLHEDVTLLDVLRGVDDAFNRERVTRRFYERFQVEHGRFLTFIKGITQDTDRAWYASLTLNRLMFVYFIQKKRLLDGNERYLRDRLERIRRERQNPTGLAPAIPFLSFYRHFLLRLFHEGLGQRSRSPELDRLLGRIPYLNGGLFDVHELESTYTAIEIDDDAFERIFDFFDEFHWHLDDRPLRNDNEINPDVLGYIFEKYINQKQMGAYYTKEDITDYIGRNTIIPYVLDVAQKECAIAFGVGGSVWRLLQDAPDTYIYETMRHGANMALPDEIAQGVSDVSKRQGWNRFVSAEYGLSTETWRECIERRERYEAIRAQLVTGDVHSVNDLITLNLDSRRFLEGAIRECEGPELLRAFYKALINLSVLDSTCGSGAFLLAALNILEPLYTACIDRMQAFVHEADRASDEAQPTSGTPRFEDFRGVLTRVDQHPNSRYFILKSIIANNLYGVDIMAEAVEICKLRLFLKLIAQVEQARDIEPLPDIDFNIQAGNTLVGFATHDEARIAVVGGPQGKMDFDGNMQRIDDRTQEADRRFQRFRAMQATQSVDSTALRAAKDDLRASLTELRSELDRYLAGQYRIDVRDGSAIEQWRRSHQPFHWFVEFYNVMHHGGFDVIIGNPPYVEYAEVKDSYCLPTDIYTTESCGNLFAFCYERCLQLVVENGRVGLIIPVASVCTEGYAPLQRLLTKKGSCVVSNFNDRPSKLFDGLEHIRLSIILYQNSNCASNTYSTGYTKWNSQERPSLFQKLSYAQTTGLNVNGGLAKIGRVTEASILAKLRKQPASLAHYQTRGGGNNIYYTRKLSYFVQILDFIPLIIDGNGNQRPPSELKRISFNDQQTAGAFLSILNSSLFYWTLSVFSDCRNLNKREIFSMPFSIEQAEPRTLQELACLAEELMADFRENSRMLIMTYKKQQMTLSIQCTYPRLSKSIIDRVDRVLARHFNFTEDELDFIINYDIKYRLGSDRDETEAS